MKSHRIIALALVCVAATVVPPPVQSALACEAGIVRDAAFDQPRDSYRLCVIANSDDPAGKEIQSQLSTWLETTGKTLNLEMVVVDADALDVRWSDYGIPSAPPELPVVVLVGKRPENGKHFFVDYWQPGPSAEDLVTLHSSPAREAIQRESVKKLAVIVHVPMRGSDGTSTRDVIDRVCRERQDLPLGFSVVTIDRNDPRERMLLSFIGIASDGPDWVGVAFGRGKFMTPLVGDEISDVSLSNLVEMVAADCTCMQSPSRLGVDLLMAWEQAADDALVRIAPQTGPADPPSAGVPLVGVSAATTETDTVPPAKASTPTAEILVLWIAGGLILLSCLGSAVVHWRK